MADAVRDDARLAAARPGQDQQRAFEMFDRFALLWVEAGQEIHVGRGKKPVYHADFSPRAGRICRNPLMQKALVSYRKLAGSVLELL